MCSKGKEVEKGGGAHLAIERRGVGGITLVHPHRDRHAL